MRIWGHGEYSESAQAIKCAQAERPRGLRLTALCCGVTAALGVGTSSIAHESDLPHNHLPPVNITAPEATPPKRVARPKPSQSRGTQSRTVVRSEQPAPATAGASGVTPAMSPDGAAALQPTAASAMRYTGAEVNAVPFSRVGEALEIARRTGLPR